ncbi:unnamed protein product, partial [Heterotrigona itama]
MKRTGYSVLATPIFCVLRVARFDNCPTVSELCRSLPKDQLNLKPFAVSN